MVRYISCAAAVLIIIVLAFSVRNAFKGDKEPGEMTRKGIAVTLQDIPEDFDAQSISGWKVINSDGESIDIKYRVSGKTEAGDDIYEITTDDPVPHGMYRLICSYSGHEIEYGVQL